MVAINTLPGSSVGIPLAELPMHQSGLSGGGASSSIDRFKEALHSAQGPGDNGSVQAARQLGGVSAAEGNGAGVHVAQAGAPASPNVGPHSKTYGQFDAEAVRPELRLGNSVAPSASRDGPGTAILEGWGRLRSIFDDQTSKVIGATSQHLSTEQLFRSQLEIAKFSVTMDVTSKLTGKATQAFDTLLKGQ